MAPEKKEQGGRQRFARRGERLRRPGREGGRERSRPPRGRPANIDEENTPKRNGEDTIPALHPDNVRIIPLGGGGDREKHDGNRIPR